MNSKIFCDIADISSIAKFNKKNIVKRTNDNLIKKFSLTNEKINIIDKPNNMNAKCLMKK